MDAQEFVNLWKKEMDLMSKDYTTGDVDTLVRKKIMSLELNDEQSKIMNEIVADILHDAYYTFLLGIDGSANIGGIQHSYKIYDEDNNLISDCGDIEGWAGEVFT